MPQCNIKPQQVWVILYGVGVNVLGKLINQMKQGGGKIAGLKKAKTFDDRPLYQNKVTLPQGGPKGGIVGQHC